MKTILAQKIPNMQTAEIQRKLKIINKLIANLWAIVTDNIYTGSQSLCLLLSESVFEGRTILTVIT